MANGAWLKMGDMSEFRGLIVLASFLGCGALLITIMPAGFNPPAAPNNNLPTDFIDAKTGMAYAYEYELNVTTVTVHDYDLAGSSWRFVCGTVDDEIGLGKWNYVLGFKWDVTWFHWHSFHAVDHGIVITPTLLDADFAVDPVLPLKYNLVEPTSGTNVSSFFFTFNQTLYATPSEAHAADELKGYHLLGMDQAQSGIDAWGLITGILMFDNPFELPTQVAYIVTLIGYATVIAFAYITYILILRAIGAVFGGGGA